MTDSQTDSDIVSEYNAYSYLQYSVSSVLAVKMTALLNSSYDAITKLSHRATTRVSTSDRPSAGLKPKKRFIQRPGKHDTIGLKQGPYVMLLTFKVGAQDGQADTRFRRRQLKLEGD